MENQNYLNLVIVLNAISAVLSVSPIVLDVFIRGAGWLILWSFLVFAPVTLITFVIGLVLVIHRKGRGLPVKGAMILWVSSVIGILPLVVIATL